MNEKILGTELSVASEAAIKSILGRMDDLYYLQKLNFLEPKFVFDFLYEDIEVKMYIPKAETDFVQRLILRRNTFYEAALLQKFAKMNVVNSESVILDIGANIGNHTVFFSKVLNVKKVVSFEPQNYCFNILNRNIVLNNLSNFTTIEQAIVGKEDGYGDINRYRTNNLGGTNFAPMSGGKYGMVSLDSYVERNGISKIDFMKIDVEGTQIEVFKGANHVLGDMKPVLWVELWPKGDEYHDAVEYLSQFGYSPEKIGNSDFLFFPK